MERQRELLAELVAALSTAGPDALDPASPTTGTPPRDDAARLRVVIDQVASLTDASAVARHARICAGAPTP